MTPEIIAACRRGDRDAFRVLYDTYKDRVYSMTLYFFHGDAATAADVTQQVFLKLMQNISQFRGDADFSTWLYRYVVNACVDNRRGGKGRTDPTDPVLLDSMAARSASHEEAFARAEIATSVQSAVARLAPKIRIAILLRYFDELSYTQMADVMKCSTGTVASRLSRGHMLLAKALASFRPAASTKER